MFDFKVHSARMAEGSLKRYFQGDDMDTSAILTGTELYQFFVNLGLSYFDELAEAQNKLADVGLDGVKIRLAMEFACCVVGLHQHVCQYMPYGVNVGEMEVSFSLQCRNKNQTTNCLLGLIDGYVIYAQNLAETVNANLMELLDYNRMISQEAYLVAQAVCQVRRQMLKSGAIKPIGRSDHCKKIDPELKKAIRFFDENFGLMEKNPVADPENLKIEFDIMVIENLAIGKIEWGMSLDELVSLVKTQIKT